MTEKSTTKDKTFILTIFDSWDIRAARRFYGRTQHEAAAALEDWLEVYLIPSFTNDQGVDDLPIPSIALQDVGPRLQDTPARIKWLTLDPYIGITGGRIYLEDAGSRIRIFDAARQPDSNEVLAAAFAGFAILLGQWQTVGIGVDRLVWAASYRDHYPPKLVEEARKAAEILAKEVVIQVEDATGQEAADLDNWPNAIGIGRPPAWPPEPGSNKPSVDEVTATVAEALSRLYEGGKDG